MKVSTIISLAFLISGLMGCAGNPAKNTLEERAGYGVNAPPMILGEAGDVQYVPSRVPEKVVVAWLNAHELPSKDYFWGSWLSILVAPEAWVMKKIAVPPSSRKTIRTQTRPTKKPPKPVVVKTAS
jgi:hypothetical protein